MRKCYYHLDVPGIAGYNMAAFFAERGYTVIAIEHLGTGDSTRPAEAVNMGLATMARGNAAAARDLLGRVRAGAVPGQSAPLTISHVMGIGHSTGGGAVCVQQDIDRTYDALAVLGFPVTWPPPDPAKPPRDPRVSAERRLQSLASDWEPFYSLDRSRTRRFFHYGDVPEAVMACDDSFDTQIPTKAAVEGLIDGVVSDSAGRIDVPVFLGFADVHESAGVANEVPYAIGREVGAYQASMDVTVFRLPRSGHSHNLASTREQLWLRLDQWAGHSGMFDDDGK